jgi:phosphatidate cytidylyltransferase
LLARTDVLKQRIITAVVLLALLIPALLAGSAWPFALLTLAFIGAAGWEWARLNGGAGFALAQGALLVLLCAGAVWLGWVTRAPDLIWWLAMLAWVLGGAWLLRGGPPVWPPIPAPLRWALGLLLLWTAWLALADARMKGINFILSVFCLVWVSDIAAYFGGRAFGKRKLALAISPGKSWEGVWSGMLAVLVVAWLWTQFIDGRAGVESISLYAQLAQRLGLAGAALALVFLSAMGVVGDLFESLVKRSAGVKDSSGLLPGHGGVLDRIDALLPVFPIALALASL